MAWTAPTTRTTGVLVTASIWNTDVVDNLTFLKTPTQSRLSAGATTNTTSAAFVDMTGVTITMSTNAAAAEVGFVGSFNISVAATAVVTLLVDGTNQGDATQGLQHVPATAATNAGISLVFRTATLSAGSHTFKLQYKTSAGTLTLLAGWSFWAVER